MGDTKINNIKVLLPDDIDGLSQDEEYCVVIEDGRERKIRFHDYDQIYSIPGLYEYVFYDVLKCRSPDIVASLLVDEVAKSGSSASDLVVLDLGAGNGIVGETLSKKGVESIVGVDIIDEAAEAVKRDRPDVYEKYFIEDLSDLDPSAHDELASSGFNCLVCVAALGFGDIPPSVFANSYNLLSDNAWVAFNIKKDFLTNEDWTGFSGMIKKIDKDGIFEINTQQTYAHRLSVSGEPLPYVAIVGRKRRNIPEEMYLPKKSSPAPLRTAGQVST